MDIFDISFALFMYIFDYWTLRHFFVHFLKALCVRHQRTWAYCCCWEAISVVYWVYPFTFPLAASASVVERLLLMFLGFKLITLITISNLEIADLLLWLTWSYFVERLLLMFTEFTCLPFPWPPLLLLLRGPLWCLLSLPVYLPLGLAASASVVERPSLMFTEFTRLPFPWPPQPLL